MDKIFYAIYNNRENKFLSIYEDGEGNEYYSSIEFSEFSNVGNPLFKTKDGAERNLKEARSLAKYANRRFNSTTKEFCDNCSIVPVQISIRFDLITKE